MANTMSVLDHMTTAEYMKLRYGDRARRNWWGIAHRWWLLDSGQYIRTSERRWKIIGEDGPELVGFRPGGIVQDPRLAPRPGEHIIHADGRAWTVGD